MDCYLTSQGATRAKAMAESLQTAGLPARVTRAPTEASALGCTYAVALPCQLLARAAHVLKRYGSYRVFRPDGFGKYREAAQ